MIIELLWIIFTLALVSIGAFVAKKYGPEYIMILVATATIMANVFASKIITFFGFYITAGTIIYTTTYFLTDLLSEFYGKKTAQKAVWLGLYACIVYFISLWIVILWQPAPFWTGQEQFSSIFETSLRITFASIAFYLIPQLHDTWAYHFWRKVTKGKHLWIRNNASTIVTQFIDTIGFIALAFYGTMPFTNLLQLIFSVYAIKVLIAIMDTPYLYAVAWWFKK